MRPGICRGPQEGDAPTLARPVPGPAFRRRRARKVYGAPPSSGEFPSVYFPFRHFRPLSVTFLLSAPPQKGPKALKIRGKHGKTPKNFARCARESLKHGKTPRIHSFFRWPLSATSCTFSDLLQNMPKCPVRSELFHATRIFSPPQNPPASGPAPQGRTPSCPPRRCPGGLQVSSGRTKVPGSASAMQHQSS